MPQNLDDATSEDSCETEYSELKLLLQVFKLDYKEHITEIALLKDEYPDIDDMTLARKLIAQVEASSWNLRSIKVKEKGKKPYIIPLSKWNKLNHDDLRYIHSQSNTESEMHDNLVKAALIAKI